MEREIKNVTDIVEEAKINIAKSLFEIKYLQKYKKIAKDEEKAYFISKMSEQISICEQLCYPVPVEKIIEWVEAEDLAKVRSEAHKIKFAS